MKKSCRLINPKSENQEKKKGGDGERFAHISRNFSTANTIKFLFINLIYIYRVPQLLKVCILVIPEDETQQAVFENLLTSYYY